MLLRSKGHFPDATHAEYIGLVKAQQALIEVFVANGEETGDFALLGSIIVSQRLAADVTTLSLEPSAKALVDFDLQGVESRIAEVTDEICRSELRIGHNKV